jgi:poly-gamma-glutamate capsule biosynthesis protein CapA/YwtB (metallophosphatase superfamily)
MARKIIVVIICIAAAVVVWHFSVISITDPAISIVNSPATAPVQTVRIGWVGDMVPATDTGYNLTSLSNVADTLDTPDLMMGNLEGTFAHSNRSSKCLYMGSMCYAFAGDPSFADTLKAAGFDFVSLINNHSLDYGTDGLKDTETELNRVGLAYIAPDKPTTSITVKGVKIGIVGVSSTGQGLTDYSYIAQTVQSLKKKNDVVIVIFHGGTEGIDKTAVPASEEYEGDEDRGNVQAVAYTSINSGADLVVGDGPHVLRKVQWYHNKPIAYSLGNFVGGNGRLATEGNLGLGGIFTTTFTTPVAVATDSTGSPQATKLQQSLPTIPTSTSFTSVLLSKDGIPSLDLTDASKTSLQSLSGGPIQ